MSGGNTNDELTEMRDQLKIELKKLFDLKDPVTGYALHPVFNTLPAKRDYPDYYVIITKPVSLSTLRKRIPHYTSPEEFVNDVKQMAENAMTYNAPDSDVYRYGEVLQKFVGQVLLPDLVFWYPDVVSKNGDSSNFSAMVNTKLKGSAAQSADRTIITEQPMAQTKDAVAQPSKEATPVRAQLSQSSTPLGAASINALASAASSSSSAKKTHVRRGRPPIIDLPYIQRMKNVLKVLKREADPTGMHKSLLTRFERLPDRASQADFYSIVASPVSVDDIWRKVKTRKYRDFGAFQLDFAQLVSNYKLYFGTIGDMPGLNTLAVLDKTFQVVTQYELAKPDKDYIPEGEFRYPIEEVLVDGKAYHIGDWVFLDNPNDPNNPIVGQIFKLWSTPDGKRWLNACWYFRPEWTVHRADRLFYKNEVMKSGQYRDHPVEDIRGKCFVIHFTRYQRGDPDFELEGPLFICEYRYNENDKIFNKIRTWKACLPEEIRDIEDKNIPVNGRKFFKYPSPIRQLLPEGASYSDPIPEPRRGLPNAPPLVGAVYVRPRLQRDDLGEYSTSEECPRYIIRPGDPQEEGQIDYVNGTILTNSNTHGSNFTRRVGDSSVGGRAGLSVSGSPGAPVVPKPKYVTNAMKIQSTMLKSPAPKNNVPPAAMANTTVPMIPISNSSSAHASMNAGAGIGMNMPAGAGLEINNAAVMNALHHQQQKQHMAMPQRVDPMQFMRNVSVPNLNNSRYGSAVPVAQQADARADSAVTQGSRLELLVKKQDSAISPLTKAQQQQKTNKAISALLQQLQTKNGVSHVIVDTPGSFVLPADIVERAKAVRAVDHGNMHRRLSKEEASSRRNGKRANETLWFRGPATVVTERVLNIGGNSGLQLPLNMQFQLQEPEKDEDEDEDEKLPPLDFEIEEAEELVVKAPTAVGAMNVGSVAPQEIIVSTLPMATGPRTIYLSASDPDDITEQPDPATAAANAPKPTLMDTSETIAMPFVTGLRCSSTFLAHRLRAQSRRAPLH
ncbi:hypothetical protein DAKH74_037590 [Maudiozyma humilis]|uniref:Uncharacterized protein n=1 Tax=Maudiozyma humilis TaxID=51915 RepID=A0AAV5S0Q3_MAUHU|nr:hypothetical protein DAKH74_037590 [Kazachstania humilis]